MARQLVHRRPTSIKLIALSVVTSILLYTFICDTYVQPVRADDNDSKRFATGAVDQGGAAAAADPEKMQQELRDLFRAKMDQDSDGQVTVDEFTKYLVFANDLNIKMHIDHYWEYYSPQIHEVFSWEGYEPEKKEVLTWDQYFNTTYPELDGVDIGLPMVREQDTSRLSTQPEETTQSAKIGGEADANSHSPEIKELRKMALRSDARWKLADENGDTLLERDEFKSLMFPEEGNEELKKLYVKEQLDDMTLNKDGSVSMDAYIEHMKNLHKDEDSTDPDWIAHHKERFTNDFDLNKDGTLDEAEIAQWLVPPKYKRFLPAAERIIKMADQNGDSKMTMGEMLAIYEHFPDFMPHESWRNEDSDKDSNTQAQHEEL